MYKFMYFTNQLYIKILCTFFGDRVTLNSLTDRGKIREICFFCRDDGSIAIR